MHLAVSQSDIVRRRSSLYVGEMIAATMVMATVVFLHIYYCIHAGALWRDEINSIDLAAMSTVREVWQSFQFDSLPWGWIGVLRLLHAAGVDADATLRNIGMCVGLLPIACLAGGIPDEI